MARVSPDDPLATIPEHFHDAAEALLEAQRRYLREHAATLPRGVHRAVLRGIHEAQRALCLALGAVVADGRLLIEALDDAFGTAEQELRSTGEDEEGYGVATLAEVHRGLIRALTH